ncbi:MAG: Rdx family protein [Phycisphaerae bacterium]
MPKAASLADAIKSALGIEAELIEGAGGVFDVKADGELIYSKGETGQFPEHPEVLEELAARSK